MKRIENTVFISYRRKDVSWALTVYQYLTHNGYDVFFDYTSIPSGDFEQSIISNIKARAHFVMILTPTTFDRCNAPGDWLRREIETAIDEKRNIIPLFFDNFNFGAKDISEKLTGKLKNVSRYNGMNVHHDYFEAAMERLRTQRLNVPLDAVLHPVSAEVRKVVKGEQLAANKALLQSSTVKPVIQQKPIIEKPPPKKDKKPKPSPSAAPKNVVPASNKLTLSNGMELMRVPAGKFLMGSTKQNKSDDDDERPQHTVDIPYDYWMARYPITNELYNPYTKYKGKIIDLVFGWAKKKDHPVVQTSWKDAMAYCQWLNNLLKGELPFGLVLRLPTEAEWEKAARWKASPSGRGQGQGEALEYPWGNTFDKNKCNTAVGGKGGTTPVGLFSPQGDSPYGCADMSGNVWEWTHSLKKAYPYNIKDGREDEKASGARVLRGGSFYNDEGLARCAYRNALVISSFYYGSGFRVVASPVLS